MNDTVRARELVEEVGEKLREIGMIGNEFKVKQKQLEAEQQDLLHLLKNNNIPEHKGAKLAARLKVVREERREIKYQNYFMTFATAFAIVLTIALCCTNGYAKSKKVKFYDFSEQQISGEIKKPTTL